MRKSKASDEQIVGICAQQTAGLVNGTEFCREHGSSRQTLQRWKAKFGGLGVSDMRRLRSLEEEDRQLVGESALSIQAVKAVVAKKF